MPFSESPRRSFSLPHAGRESQITLCVIVEEECRLDLVVFFQYGMETPNNFVIMPSWRLSNSSRVSQVVAL